MSDALTGAARDADGKLVHDALALALYIAECAGHQEHLDAAEKAARAALPALARLLAAVEAAQKSDTTESASFMLAHGFVEPDEREEQESGGVVPTPSSTDADSFEVCEVCIAPYAVWFTPSDVWNEVMARGDGYAFICPTCFTKVAEKRGVGTTAWLVTPEPQPVWPLRLASQVTTHPYDGFEEAPRTPEPEATPEDVAALRARAETAERERDEARQRLEDERELWWPREEADRMRAAEARAVALKRALAQANRELEERRHGHIGDAMLRNELVNHFPVELRCDHEAKQDMVVCDCATANLGWHPSVRRAKEAWARHVEEACKSKRLVAGVCPADSSEERG